MLATTNEKLAMQLEVAHAYIKTIKEEVVALAVIKLSMLRTSRINTKLSDSTHIDGPYYYNRAPMAPPGTRIIAHETPNHRRTWEPMDKMAGTLDHLWSIIDATQCT
jgi:hypothetical protein